jgi:hypothetical protein
MYAFDRWQVVDDPAFGRATITLWLNAAGVPEGDPFPASPSLVSQSSGLGDNLVNDDTRKFTFRIKAKSWHLSGRRPFACDAMAQDWKGAVRYPFIVFVISADAELDRMDFDRKCAMNKIGLGYTAEVPRLNVLRVMNSARIPDLSEPSHIPDLLTAELWSVEEACLDDWKSLSRNSATRSRQAPFQLVSPTGNLQGAFSKPWEYLATEKQLQSTLKELYGDWVRVSHLENAMTFECGADLAIGNRQSSNAATRWRVSLRWSGDRPARVLWSWESPYRFINEEDLPQSRLRILASKEVLDSLSFEILEHEGRDQLGFELETTDLRTWINFDPVRVEVDEIQSTDVAITAFIESGRDFELRYPHRPEQATRLLLQRDPAAIAGMILLPLTVIPSPAQPVAAVLAAALSVASLYCAQAERAHVAQHGYDSSWQPRTLAEVESDFRLGPEAALQTRAQRFPKTFHKEIQGAGSKTLPDRTTAIALLNEMAVSRILSIDRRAFQIEALQSLYDEYLVGIRINFEAVESGIDLSRADGRLGLDPLSWLLRGASGSSRKSRVMQALLGETWKEKIRGLRQYIPLSEDVLELHRLFAKKAPGTLTYGEAIRLRNQIVPEKLKRIGIYIEEFFHPRGARLLKLVRGANRKSFGALFELEHPFERRFILRFASPLDKMGVEVLDYVTEAKVLLVPKNRNVAKQIPDFEGYVHWEKSRRMEALIPYGQEAMYSLQEMRDAHVFAISSLAGPDSPAIAMVDDAAQLIAKRTGSSVVLTDPRLPTFRARFVESSAPDSWRYLPLNEKARHAMRMEQYIYQRLLIDRFAKLQS